MTQEQLTDIVLRQTSEISACAESTKSAHKRIDKNDRMIEGIHKIAANMEALTLQVKTLTEKMESSVERIETSQEKQGERIGALEKEPAHKWRDLVKQVIALAIAAVVGAVTGKFTN